MKKIGDKRAAIELSISTIVIVVLAMSMLILGLVLIRAIFSGAKNVVDLNNEQLTDEISKIYGEDKRVVVYPKSQRIDVVQGEPGGFGIGIRNLNTGSSATAGSDFSYEVVISDLDVRRKCGVSDAEIMNYIVTGKTETNLQIATGELVASKVVFETDIGSPLCTVRFRVNVKYGGAAYDSAFMDVTFKSQ